MVRYKVEHTYQCERFIFYSFSQFSTWNLFCDSYLSALVISTGTLSGAHNLGFVCDHDKCEIRADTDKFTTYTNMLVYSEYNKVFMN